MTGSSLFHEGEIAVQQLCGEATLAERLHSLIKPTVLPRALGFLRQQSVLWIGVQDEKNNPWAYPVFGSPGFIDPHDGELIEIDLSRQNALPDTWLADLQPGKFIGCLAIELSSRLRLRINGVIKSSCAEKLQIEVQQSYPNCQKYIRRRIVENNPAVYEWQNVAGGVELTPQLVRIIQHADTAFVASIGPNGADVSHRGGATGFIGIEGDNKIIVPDYQGNSLFNTLGNFKLNPKGGLLIVDFDHGDFLQLTGEVDIVLDREHPNAVSGGTRRHWIMHIRQWRLHQLQNRIKWQSLEFSPHNPVVS